MYQHRVFTCTLLPLAGIVLSSQPSLAQSYATPVQLSARHPTYSNPVVRLDPVSLRRFDTAVLSLAKQARVAIVCEGQPLALELSEAAVKHLVEQAANRSTLPLEEAVQHTAAAFDYDAVRTGATTFLLTKRYSNPDDLPDVTFEEVAGSLRNTLHSTNRFFPAPIPGNIAQEILRSSSSVQRERLAQGIPVSALSETQRQMAWQFACSFDFSSLEHIEKVAQRLQVCRTPDAVMFTKRQFWNLTLPIYQGPFARGGATAIVALGSWIYTQSGGGTLFEGPDGVELIDKTIVSKGNLPDPTTPRPAAQIPAVPTSSLRYSLGAVMERINRRLNGNAALSKVTADASVAAKSVCLVGDDFASPDALVQAVADVYGLQVRRGNDSARITLPLPRRITSPDSVGPEVRRLLPAPFLRAIRNQDPLDTSGEFSLKRSKALYIAAVRRLREIVEPKVEQQPEGKLPFAEAGEAAHDLVALSSLATCAVCVQMLLEPPTRLVWAFDHATLALAPSTETANSIRFAIQAVDASGKGSSISGNVGLPPEPTPVRSR